jgi:hypothetical protein
MKLKPLVLLLAASVLASGCSQTVKSTLDAPTDVTYQVADEDASGIPIVEPDAALNPATMPTVAQLILIEYGKTSVTQFEALLGSPSKVVKVSPNSGFVIFDSNRVVGGRTEKNPGVLVVHEQLARDRHYPYMSILLSIKKKHDDWVVTGFKIGLRLDASKALE